MVAGCVCVVCTACVCVTYVFDVRGCVLCMLVYGMSATDNFKEPVFSLSPSRVPGIELRSTGFYRDQSLPTKLAHQSGSNFETPKKYEFFLSGGGGSMVSAQYIPIRKH